MVRYPTGISGLDTALGGGIEPGSLVAIEIDSTSQGDALLRHLTAQQPTLYLSTTRTVRDVEEWLRDDQLLVDITSVRVEFIDADDKLGAVSEYVDQFSNPANVVIDPVNRLETGDEEEYSRTLHRLKDYLRENRRIGYLHVESHHRSNAADDNHGYAATYRAADMVWRLSSHVSDDAITTRLAVTKRRGGATPDRPLQLKIGTEIVVDTSRNISF